MSDFNSFKNSVIAGTIQGLKEAADIIKEDAKQRAPVDTGTLKDSITILEDDETNIKIGSGLPYAFVQHETNKSHPFFLRNALIDNEQQIMQKIKEEIEENMG